MARFLLRSLVSTAVTMFMVSAVLFYLLEVGGGDVTIKLLGVFATPEQRDSYRKQLGLDRSAALRYRDWLMGNDWVAARLVGHPLVVVANERTGEKQWWVEVDGRLTRWEMTAEGLNALIRQPDGTVVREPAGEVWIRTAEGVEQFWGVNSQNSAVRWVRGEEQTAYERTAAGIREVPNAPVEYLPLRKGLLRGDAGQSLQTGRPVAATLWPRVRNTAVLAGTAFAIVMPLALVLGVVAGVNEGRPVDRLISITGLALTAIPEFVTGLVLILIFGLWLRWFPAVSVFLSDDALWRDPTLIALPVLTLTAVELGYVARMTRASMVEVMASPYIRTAIIKGLPMRRVVWRHALRNALMVPITMMMLHINWLIGGVVVVEVLFGFPGLGQYIYEAAVFGDYNAVEAAAMLTVAIAVFTRLLGDILYTFLNPRIRYS